jgi:glycerophosphoryl diester phosphodiesterase
VSDRGTRPQVVAHRGASHDNAEHTLKAYVKALEAGADGLECDVRLTADGHLICVHDRDLRRTASNRGLVSTMDLADLDQLDFASWKNPWSDLDDEAEDPDPREGRVLTLRKLFETVADLDRPVQLAVETKHPTRYGGLVERRLAQLLADFGWDTADGPVRVMSFSYTALLRMSRLAPRLPLVMLVDTMRSWQVLRQVVADDWVLGPGVEFLRDHPRTARWIASSGRVVDVWVVNTRADLDLCRSLGVRSVITDRPAYMRELLDG